MSLSEETFQRPAAPVPSLCGRINVHNENSVVSCDLVLNTTWQKRDLCSGLSCKVKVILTPAP